MSEAHFVHLQCQSEYSIKNSLIRIPELISQAKALKMKAIALTEDINLFSAIKFYQQATSNDIKPIFGASVVVKNVDFNYSVLLLCQNNEGYINLCDIISRSYSKEKSHEGAYVEEKYLQERNQGLLLIASAVKSDVAKFLLKNNKKQAVASAKKWQSIFADRYYFAVQRTSREFDEQHLNLTIDLACELDIAVIATNDVQFISSDEFDAHEARICIYESDILDNHERVSNFSNAQYLKSASEMKELFIDLPDVLINTVEIAKRCNLHFEIFKEHHLPAFPTPENLSLKEFFQKQCKKGLDIKIKNENLDRKIYEERLNFEIDIIIRMDFVGYFLIVSDFILWAKNNGIPVGPGRGSGVGSLVAWVLSITNINPVKHGLIFERFLNPERRSMPDFDIDFCTERRDEVIEYVASKYGQEKVSQIITYGTMAAKAVVRDAGRVLGNSYGFNDSVAKLIPNELNITLEKALKDSKELSFRYAAEESVTTLIDLSKRLEGLIRNAGTHAGGVVIAPRKITDFCPTYKGPNDEDVLVSQFDKKDIEAIGLVKFDFLGLANLTVIDKTLKLIKAKGLTKEFIDIDNLNLDDKNVYKVLQKCHTVGVFQLESEGMRSYLKKLKPDSFEDIVAMLALYRPGPLEAKMVDTYIDVKHGQKASYPHDILKGILQPTNSIFLYQEQVMQTAQLMAGYSMGKADLLRKVMGDKNKKEMAKHRDGFVKGALKNNIDKETSDKIFDLIEKFAGYGFNKSHSVAYAYISYQTAWLKAYYPAAFMASVLSGVMDDTDRIAVVVDEVKKINIIINPPNINDSEYQFSIADDKTIIYGLGAIKGVGRSLAEDIVANRKKNGDYADLFDFCLRTNRHLLNRRALEALILSGCFDTFAIKRSVLIANYPKVLGVAEQINEDLNNGQKGLFANDERRTDNIFKYNEVVYMPFTKMLQKEKEVMGYYLNSHPTDIFAKELEFINSKLPKNVVFRNDREVKVLACIADIKYRDTRKGKMAIIVLADGVSKINAVLFDSLIDKNKELLEIDNIVVVSGRTKKDFRDNWQISVDNLQSVADSREDFARYMLIKLTSDDRVNFAKIAKILKDNPGRCPVIIQYTNDHAYGKIPLKSDYAIALNDKLINSLGKLISNTSYTIQY